MKATEPAFPRNYDHNGHNGLTKREYLAALAMQGILSTESTVIGGSLSKHFEAIASLSVGYADALIKELRKEVQS